MTDNPNHSTYCTAEFPYEYEMGTFPLLKLPVFYDEFQSGLLPSVRATEAASYEK